MTQADVIVIGGGIAGASAGFALAERRRVVVLESEAFCGYHSTGRSAASFTENYGTAVIRRLARASRSFFENPPGEGPLIHPRGMITIARDDQRATLAEAFVQGRKFAPSLCEIAPAEALRRVPILRPDYVAAAFFEPGSLDIDVHAVHQTFLKGLRARGGSVVTEAEVTALAHENGIWTAVTRAGRFSGAIVVNAAGAWADKIGALAGTRPIGLVPKRRSAFTIAAPSGVAVDEWPLINDVGEKFYFKPDAGQLLVSPADATPSEPCDAQPEDLDIAIGIDRLQQATTLDVRHVRHKWAGLRNFVADGSPVVGWDGERKNFLWLAGQGGYGIKTSPALSRIVASLVEDNRLPSDLIDAGLSEQDLSPQRCRAEEI